MHVYLNAKKCLSAIDNAEYIDEDKINEALFHIWLHLESNLFIQIQHVTKPYYLWRYLKNFYESMEFNAELLLCKNLLNIMLIKSNNNIEIYLSKMKKSFDDLRFKKCDLLFNFFADLILSGLNRKYKLIISTIINHVRATGGVTNSINKVGQNLDWMYYLIMNETRRIDLRNASHAHVNDVKEIAMTS